MAEYWDDEYKQVKMLKYFNIYNEDINQTDNASFNYRDCDTSLLELPELPETDYFE